MMGREVTFGCVRSLLIRSVYGLVWEQVSPWSPREEGLRPACMLLGGDIVN